MKIIITKINHCSTLYKYVVYRFLSSNPKVDLFMLKNIPSQISKKNLRIILLNHHFIVIFIELAQLSLNDLDVFGAPFDCNALLIYGITGFIILTVR